MWKGGGEKLKYKGGGGGGPHFCFDFSVPSELHEVYLDSFHVINGAVSTIHKDNQNLNHHRQGLRFINDLTLILMLDLLAILAAFTGF